MPVFSYPSSTLYPGSLSYPGTTASEDEFDLDFPVDYSGKVTYYIDTNSPAIVRSIANQATGTMNLVPGHSFKLRVRPRDAQNYIVDAAMDPDFVNDVVIYRPSPTDFTEEGIYRAWIVADFGNSVVQEIDEFEIVVLAHAPGQAARTGNIWRAARAMAPVAWDYLREYIDYGDFELQRQIDLAKVRVLKAAYVDAENEHNLDPRVIDYVARKALVDSILNAAINFWTNQVIQVSARSNSDEVKTYPDRIVATERLLERYRHQLREAQSEVDEILGGSSALVLQGPSLVGGGEPITPGLELFPRPYGDGWGNTYGWSE